MIVVRAVYAGDSVVAAPLLARAFIGGPAMAYLLWNAATRASRLDRFFAVIAHIDDDVGHRSMALDPAGVPLAAALWRLPGA